MFVLPTPICKISNKPSHKFCISPFCSVPAFICKFCQNDECEKMHEHNDKFQIMMWQQIKSIFHTVQQNSINHQLIESINRLNKEVYKLQQNINLIGQVYLSRVQEVKKEMKFNVQYQRVKIMTQNQNFCNTVGKEMAIIYNNLQLKNYVQYKVQIQKIMDVQIDRALTSLNKIRGELEKYFDKYLQIQQIKIPEDWSREDQEKIKKLIGLIKEFPLIADNYNERGLIYYNNKMHERALIDYNKAIQLNPKLATAYNRRGNIYYNRNQFEKALAQYNQAIIFDRKLANAYNNRGNIYRNINQIQKALTEFNLAIQCDQKFCLAYYNRGLLFYNLKEIQKALNDQNAAIQCDPKFSRAYNMRGLIFKQKNEYENALKNFNKAIELDKKYSDAYINRALLYQTRNQFQKALYDYTKSIEYNPIAISYNHRGNIYYKHNMFQEALKDYNKVIALDKNTKVGYNNRSRVYRKLNRIKEAEADQKIHNELMKK